MNKITILRGLPGSGKSTLARDIARKTGASIVSLDEIRKEQKSESRTQKKKDIRIAELLSSGDVIYDSTAANPRRIEEIKERFGDIADIEIVSVDTPPEECVKRDSTRAEEERVGSIAIWSLYHKYFS